MSNARFAYVGAVLVLLVVAGCTSTGAPLVSLSPAQIAATSKLASDNLACDAATAPGVATAIMAPTGDVGKAIQTGTVVATALATIPPCQAISTDIVALAAANQAAFAPTK